MFRFIACCAITFLVVSSVRVRGDIPLNVMEEFILPLETDRICQEAFGAPLLEDESRKYALSVLEKPTRNPAVYRSLNNHTRGIFRDVYASLVSSTLLESDPDDYIPTDDDLPQESRPNQELMDYLEDKQIIEVPRILPGHQENAAKTTALKPEDVAVPDVFDRLSYRQSGVEDSCIWLSTIASYMKTAAGRSKIKNLLKGTDDHFAYFKFYEPTPEFIQKARRNNEIREVTDNLRESVYKVPLNIIETATAEPSYPKYSPSWLHLLMRAYHYLVLKYKEMFWWFPNMEDRFSEVCPTVCTGDRQGELIYFSPLVGKEQLRLLKNAPDDEDYDPHLKDLLKNNNGIIYGRDGHALALLADGRNVSRYDTLGGLEQNIPEFNNLDAMSNNTFISGIFREIARQNAGPFFYYSAESLDK